MTLQGRVEKISLHDVVEAKETAEQVVKQRARARAKKKNLDSGSSALSDSELSDSELSDSELSDSELSDSELPDSELPDLLKVSEVSEVSEPSMATISMLAASV
jgi:hypothetical protein